MNVNFKKENPKSIMPRKAHSSDGGYDLVSVAVKLEELDTMKNKDLLYVEYDTGISVEIPTGFVGKVYARSSISNTGWSLANGVGIIDSGYRGTIKLRFVPNNSTTPKSRIVDLPYGLNQKIGQLMIEPSININFIQSERLTETVRSERGFGSTGN